MMGARKNLSVRGFQGALLEPRSMKPTIQTAGEVLAPAEPERSSVDNVISAINVNRISGDQPSRVMS
jgi:hypothetical protein